MDIKKILADHALWLSHKGGCRADLREMNLEGMDLREANLAVADLEGANLRGADLRRADLEGANLEEANLRGANLEGANLEGVNFCGADLRRADLSRADLSRANLEGVNLYRVDLAGANFGPVYIDIPVTLEEVRAVILANKDRLNMESWHGDDEWHNGVAKPVNDCGTTHCVAGWAHHLAALKRPELLDPKVNVYLVGRLALGDAAAEHFFDDEEEALEWLEGMEVMP